MKIDVQLMPQILPE